MSADDAPVGEIEDVRCEGYAEALTADAWLTRSARRLHDLLEDPSPAVRGRELPAVAGEHVALRRGLAALRRQLAGFDESDDTEPGPQKQR